MSIKEKLKNVMRKIKKLVTINSKPTQNEEDEEEELYRVYGGE